MIAALLGQIKEMCTKLIAIETGLWIKNCSCGTTDMKRNVKNASFAVENYLYSNFLIILIFPRAKALKACIISPGKG